MKRVIRRIAPFPGFYLLGILACILLTPVESGLVGKPAWLMYAAYAPIGFIIFYVNLPPQYVFGPTPGYWAVYALGLASLLLGLALMIAGRGRSRSWSPALIGLPLGFVGTLGVYYAALASV